jgi:hypothetical protein
MKPSTKIPIWLVFFAAVAAADNLWCSRNSCCLSRADQSEACAIEENEPSGPMAKKRESLGKLNEYVGEWRGVGQPKRGSTKDSWVEQSGWAYQFAPDDVSLRLNSDGAKYLRSAELRPGPEPDGYELTAKTTDGAEIKYAGKLGADGLILTAAKPIEGAPARVSIRMVAGGDRMVVLYERQAEADRFTRLAEVGLTRKGSGFGKGTSYIECVVTGGLGTIEVTHAGKTYYVCCTGCRDYFNDNAEEVLAEYRARKAAKK